MNEINFANLKFRGLEKQKLLEDDTSLKFIVTVNAEFIIKANSDNEFKKIINDNYSTFDGQVPYYLAKKQNPDIYFEKLSGSDLIYDFAEMAKEKHKKIFLLGGYEESNAQAVEKLRNTYNITIEGFSPEYKPYPFEEEHNNNILKKIKSFSPDILFVGFGAIKQEYWINENKDFLKKVGVKWVVGSGGTFEFVADTIKRAPVWIQNIGLEGIYRMLKEPNMARVKRILLSFKIFKYIKQ
jgi:N-acetylglucosaminyldiphosphoundecaprenol N-acetyl-beta-D-mannosaminyltransferase